MQSPETTATQSVAQSVAQSAALPPETLEGWYALHQIFSVVPEQTTDVSPPRVDSTQVAGIADESQDGWSAMVRLIGSKSDYLVMHFRPSLDAIGVAQQRLAALPTMRSLRIDYSFLSVTEAGLYHLTAKLAREASARGGSVGDATYVGELTTRAAAERDSAHVRRRLYPTIPDGMPYVSFYPMSKRRNADQNWYGLSLDERSRLMQSHGMIGRRYAGRVVQIISGAIGLDAWEWGVTLFARDPLDFKKLVTDMRFDETSAQYAEFGDFYVGKMMSETPEPTR
jgi:chlorite dismutase